MDNEVMLVENPYNHKVYYPFNPHIDYYFYDVTTSFSSYKTNTRNVSRRKYTCSILWNS